ncbi:ribonuclease H-like domain-containing protein [Alkalihalobacillus oceani]|uniref:ribonuclease H-like domain-containing protein n=1 Tax=Halalkalibacter oceani TaxID=1653776 RepID=UPI00203F79C1|nr:ribonuclease H-like domain-containing protein [Halalkalibacter oceani]MCM3762132.1 ribonuclease H-like domain-containing protein [Halalkalibacter oceani]
MMKQKLQRMKQHLQLQEKQPLSDREPDADSPQQEVPFEKEWAELQVIPHWFDEEYTLIREKSYPLAHQHGRFRFSAVEEAVARWQDHLGHHPLSAKDRQAGDLLFFDTETTGLSSGAGNTIFLLGYAKIEEGEVRVKQYFLPGPEHEVALYHHFLKDVTDRRNLVTYNGKSFDWPQVKTRHTFVRDQVPKLPQFGHFDLLHAARRLWKETLPSCKLSVVEEQVLQFNRVEDIPGYMAPLLYFDFLQEQHPDYMKGIFQHHEWDVLSLMTLYACQSMLVLEWLQHGNRPSRREAYEIARWYEAAGEGELAATLYAQLLEGDDDIAEHARFAYAAGLKRQAKWEAAFYHYKFLARLSIYPFEAAIECAKLAEHKRKDPEQAIYYSELAARHLPADRKQKQLNLELQKRVERLLKKTGKE